MPPPYQMDSNWNVGETCKVKQMHKEKKKNELIFRLNQCKSTEKWYFSLFWTWYVWSLKRRKKIVVGNCFMTCERRGSYSNSSTVERYSLGCQNGNRMSFKLTSHCWIDRRARSRLHQSNFIITNLLWRFSFNSSWTVALAWYDRFVYYGDFSDSSLAMHLSWLVLDVGFFLFIHQLTLSCVIFMANGRELQALKHTQVVLCECLCVVCEYVQFICNVARMQWLDSLKM